MFWESRLGNLLQHFRSPAKVVKSSSAGDFVQLFVDRLEERRVLSVSVGLDALGILSIDGDAADDGVSIRLDNAGLPNEMIVVTDYGVMGPPPSWTFNTNDVSGININLGDGSDVLVIQIPSGQASNYGSISLMIDGGLGDDTVAILDNGGVDAASETTVTVESETIQFFSSDGILTPPVTFGAVDFDLTGNVIVTEDLTLITDGHFHLNGDVVTTTAHDFELTADGIDIDGVIGDVLPGSSFGDLSLNAGLSDLRIGNTHSTGSVSLSGASVIVDGNTLETVIEGSDITVDGSLHLSENTTLLTSTGDINLGNTPIIADAVDLDLTLNSSGDVFLSEVNTDLLAMGGLDVVIDAMGATTLNGNVNNLCNLEVNSGPVFINATSIFASGNQTYLEAVTLGSNAVLSGAALQFGSLNTDSDPFSLTLRGATTVNGELNIGGNLVLDSLITTTNGGDVIVGGNFTAPVGVTSNGAINVTGTSSLGGVVSSLTGNISLGNNVTLTSDVALISATNTLITGNVNGVFDLTLNAVMGSTITGMIGVDVINLRVIQGDLSTGAIDITGNLIADGNVSTRTGNIQIDGTVDIEGEMNSFGLIDIGGVSEFGGDVTAETTITLRSNVTLTKDVTFSADTTIQVIGNVNGDGSSLRDVTFAGTLTTITGGIGPDVEDVDVTTGALSAATINISGTLLTQSDVTTTGNLTANTVDVGGDFSVGGELHVVDAVEVGGSMMVTGASSLCGDVTVTGAVEFTGAVELTADITVTSVTSNVTFGSTVNSDSSGTYSLTANASAGSTTFMGLVGAEVDGILKALTVNANDIQLKQNTFVAGDISLNGNTIRVDQNVQTTTGGSVSILNSGLLTLSNTASFNLDGAFIQLGAGLVELGGNITTTGDIVFFNSGVTLAKSVSINTANGVATGADITFNNTLDGTTADTEDLTLNAGSSGDVLFNATVGQSKSLKDITITNSANVDFKAALTANSLRQTAGTGTTTLDGLVTVKAASGLQLSTVNIDVNGGINAHTNAQIVLNAMDDLTINSQVNSDSGVITLNATDKVNFTAASDVTSTSGKINALGKSITMADATLINAGTDTITFNATGDITLGSLLTSNASDQAINVTTTAGAIIDAGNTHVDISAANGQVNLSAATGIGSNDQLEIQAAKVSATNHTSGNIRLDAVAGNLEVLTLDNMGLGNINVRTITGNLVTTGLVSTTGAGSIDLTANNGELRINSTIDSVNGAITLMSNNGEVVVNSAITSTNGAVSLTSSTSDISLTAIGTITTDTGTVGLRATAGKISQTSGSIINAGDATVSMIASEDITLAQIITTNSTNAAVSLTTTAGALKSVNATLLNIDAANGRLVIDAETSVGPLNTKVDSLDVLSSGGRVEISETDDINVIRITDKGTGPLTLVDLSAGGTLTLVNSQPGIDATTVKLTVTETESDIVINSQISADDVEFTAADEISFGESSTVNAGSSVDLQAGGSINLAANSTIRTPLLTANSGGAITMVDTSTIHSIGGSATLIAVGDVSVSRIIATDVIGIVSTSGGITDAGNSGGADLIANSLRLGAANGIGSSDSLETEVAILETFNAISGSINIDNAANAALQLNGITNAGIGGGEINISNTGTINVDASLTNTSGGKLNLIATDSSNSPGTINVNGGGAILSQGTQADIFLTAATDLNIYDTGVTNDIVGQSITGSAGRNVTIAPTGVIVRSATGSVTKTTPDLVYVVTPQVLATGISVIQGDFGDTDNNNFIFNIVWDMEGPVEDTFHSGDPIFNNETNSIVGTTPGVGPGSFSFDHQYFGNPDELNPANDIPITITLFDDPNITFLENGVDLGQTSITSFADVPGEGLAGGFVFNLSIEVPQIAAPRVEFSDSNDVTSDETSTTEEFTEVQSVVETESVSDDRILFIEKIGPDGKVEIDSNGKPIQQSLFGDQAQALLDDLPTLYKTLDEGHWRIYLKEGGDAQQQLISDAILRDGVPVTQEAGTQDRPPTEEANFAPPDNAESMKNVSEKNPVSEDPKEHIEEDYPPPPPLPEPLEKKESANQLSAKTTFAVVSIALMPMSQSPLTRLLRRIKSFLQS